MIGITTATNFNDDYVPPNQQMYYKVVGTNRAGSSSPSGAASATSVDVAALTTANTYLFAGFPGLFADGNPNDGDSTNSLAPTFIQIDNDGNIYAAYSNYDEVTRIEFIPKKSGTYFGLSMAANSIYPIKINLMYVYGLGVDSGGNVYIAY